jgi:protein associated with RNAse G/E
MARVGSEVALRDIWFERVWRANAARVVANDDDLVVLWIPQGSPAMYPVDASGHEVRIPNAEAVLTERVAYRDALALLRPNGRYSIWLFWEEEGTFEHWYVNLERTLGWNGVCFDMVDHKLDLIVSADTTVRWKDEDELEQAASLNLVDAEDVRMEATKLLERWPFPTGWEQFRPEPEWPLPGLPPGWDQV